MTKILFVCHGNICRSPMAEFILKDLVNKKGCAADFDIASAATSTEEIGQPVHHGTRDRLAKENISVTGKTAVQLRRSDYDRYDYLIGMDARNITNMVRISGGDPDGKISRLLDFTPSPRDIADPWYTGAFDITYEDILLGCQALLTQLDS
jgi:protein-tyrosine phosphatase